MRVRAQRAWLPSGLVDDVVVVTDEGGVITEVRPGGRGDGPLLGGLVVPGLVNAHAHLELSHRAGAVPGGQGFVPWAAALMQQTGGDREVSGRQAAVDARDAGTAWLVDVSNGGDTGPWLAAAGLGGVVHHELLGLDAGQLPDRLALARSYGAAATEPAVRPVPHALFSTAPELVVACVAAGPGGLPASMHVAEAADEAAFLADGTGPFAALLDRLGRDWRWWTPPGVRALHVLDGLGVLGPGLVLVHGVHLSGDELALAAARHAGLVTCPRSNLHIGGQLADLPAWRAHGLRFGIGTDSLASTPDLDLLGEVAVLARAWPDLPLEGWLSALTHDGADLVGAPVGRLAVGAAPGVLWLDLADVDGLRDGAVGRRWLA